MPGLQIRDLRHIYAGGVRALDGVTLDVSPGLFGLLGPNGAGKSTLMRLIATLQLPTEGSIRFGGIDVLAEPERLRRTLGYLPQDFGAYPRVSIEDMLDHLAVLKGIVDRRERRELVSALLDKVNLWPVRRRALERCSGGMRQRFGIAQALIGEPQLIVVDEPTAGLDPEERNRCLDLLAAIGNEAIVILSTHIVADVADLCPCMAVLAHGRILIQGAPSDLRASLAGRIWRKAIDRGELDAHRAAYATISARLTERVAARQALSKPLVTALETLFREKRTILSARNETAKAINYSLNHWPAFTLVDEPTIRPSGHIFVGSKTPWFTITDDLPQDDGHIAEDGTRAAERSSSGANGQESASATPR